MGGDFRQVLPVVLNAWHPAHIIHTAIKRSPLYAHFEHLSLTQNMRASEADQEFITLLMNVCNGSANERLNQQRTQNIVIPSRYLLTIPDEMMIVTKISNIPTSFVISFDMSLVIGDAIFSSDPMSMNSIAQRVILCALNEDTHFINDNILDRMPSVVKEYKAMMKQ
jgi:hypothetical protein